MKNRSGTVVGDEVNANGRGGPRHRARNGHVTDLIGRTDQIDARRTETGARPAGNVLQSQIPGADAVPLGGVLRSAAGLSVGAPIGAWADVYGGAVGQVTYT